MLLLIIVTGVSPTATVLPNIYNTPLLFIKFLYPTTSLILGL